MDLLALVPHELRRGKHMICRIASGSFVVCGFIKHARRIAPAPAPAGGLYGLSVAIAGSAIYRDRHGATHPLSAGAIFQFSDPPGGSVGRVEPEPGFFECTVSFAATIGTKLIELGIWKNGFLHAATEPSAALLQRYLDLHARMVASPISYDETLRGIISIVDVAYAHAAGISAEERLIAEARRLLAETEDADYTPRQAARDLGMPYETFRKRFQRHVGMSPQAYRLRELMRRASAWLGEASVKEVAARLGYGNQFAFSRQFKKVMGASPKTFKR